MYEGISHDDLVTLLGSSIIYWDKKPVFVHNIDADNKLHLKSFIKDGMKVTEVTDKRLDFTPVKLGMCNHGGAAFYLSRMPTRQWCQGLNQSNLRVDDVAHSEKTNAHVEIKKLKANSFYQCIMGEYPKIEDVLDILSREDEKVFSMAFSSSFALDRELNLYFKTERVGMYDVKKMSPNFLKSKGYLEEVVYG